MIKTENGPSLSLKSRTTPQNNLPYFFFSFSFCFLSISYTCYFSTTWRIMYVHVVNIYNQSFIVSKMLQWSCLNTYFIYICYKMYYLRVKLPGQLSHTIKFLPKKSIFTPTDTTRVFFIYRLTNTGLYQTFRILSSKSTWWDYHFKWLLPQ